MPPRRLSGQRLIRSLPTVEAVVRDLALMAAGTGVRPTPVLVPSRLSDRERLDPHDPQR